MAAAALALTVPIWIYIKLEDGLKMRIEFTGKVIPVLTFSEEGGQSVTFASTFYKPPLCIPKYNEIWLDTNIISQREFNPNIASFVQMGIMCKFRINPVFALAEFHRGHDPITAADMMLNRLPRMEQMYNFTFDMDAVVHHAAHLPMMVDVDRAYIQNLSDMLLVVKYFYAKKDWSFEARLTAYAKLVKNHLPHFAIVFYVASVYYFAKQRRDLFELTFPKVQEAMHVHGSAEKNRKEADNLASDLAIFTQTTYAPINLEPTMFRVPYIATSDAGFALLLTELTYYGVNVENGKGHGSPGFKIGGVMHNETFGLVRKIVNDHLTNLPTSPERLEKLRTVSSNILDGTFDHRKMI